jgi:outer membrane protein
VFDPAAGLPAEILMMFPPGSLEPSVIQEHVQYGAALTLSQNLFNISVLRAPGAAKASRAAALARVESTEDDLLFQAATAYATAVGLKGMESASERALAVAEQRTKDARLQLEAGTTTPLTLTRAETDRVVAEGQRTSVRARRATLLATLKALTGIQGQLELKDERIVERVKTAGEDYEKRTVIVARTRELEAQEKQVGLSNMKWLPVLSLDGRVSYASAQGFAGDDVIATATLNLVVPIYDSGVRYADTAIAEARVLQAQHLLENERLLARAFLEESRATLDSSKAELEIAKAQLEVAVQGVKQAEDLVAHGAATNLELNDADAKRFQADRTVVQKQLELDLAALRAYYAAGGRLLAPKPNGD